MGSDRQRCTESVEVLLLERAIRTVIGMKTRMHRCQGCQGPCATDFETFYRSVMCSVDVMYDVNMLMSRFNGAFIPLSTIERLMYEMIDVYKPRCRSLYCCH